MVGVVGTNGKTSTKELIRAALGAVLEVHATTGNLNNLVGVPLTLLAIPDDAEVAVIEMGTNQPGEVPRCARSSSRTSIVVTSVAEEHLEGLGDLAGVLREELAAADGVRRRDRPVVAAGGRRRRARRARSDVVAAGLDDGDLTPSAWGVAADGAGR